MKKWHFWAALEKALTVPKRKALDQAAIDEQKTQICEALEGLAEYDKSQMTFKNLPAPNGNLFYEVGTDGADPAKTVLVLTEIPEALAPYINRIMDATKAAGEAGCGVKRLDAKETHEWCLFAHGGEEVKERDHKAHAELLANVHKVDPAWFDKYREAAGEKFECLKEAGAGAPIWWYTQHGSMLDGMAADDVKDFAEDCPEPLSEYGKKVVTCHGDFHQGNIIKNGDTWWARDWESACSGYAALDIAYYLGVTPLTPPQRKEFLEAYLKASGMEEVSEEELAKLSFDVETCSVRSGYFNGWMATYNAKKSVKGYNGEVWTMLKAFEAKAREGEGSEDLQKNVVANGLWTAACADNADMKKAWEKHGKIYTIGGDRGCCRCQIF